MHTLKPLDQIPCPTPPADEIYRVRLFDHDYSFVGLKSLLGAMAELAQGGGSRGGVGRADRNRARGGPHDPLVADAAARSTIGRRSPDDEGQI